MTNNEIDLFKALIGSIRDPAIIETLLGSKTKEIWKSMAQNWIIDGEWSEYHRMVAQQDGWSLTQKQGMWEITSLDEKKFPTDDDARQHVLANEFNEENIIYGYAINAIMVGNVRG